MISGYLSDLGQAGFSTASCQVTDHVPLTWDDGRSPLGDGYYYLVRARNNCGVGHFGTSGDTVNHRADLLAEGDPCP